MSSVNVGGFGFSTYTDYYLEASRRLVEVTPLGPTALPAFFMLRHTMELAMKSILEAVADNARDERALEVFAQHDDVVRARNVFDEPLSNFLSTAKALSSHDLIVLQGALLAEKVVLSDSVRGAVAQIHEFELGQPDRSRFPTERTRRKQSLPSFLESPVTLHLGELLELVEKSVHDLVNAEESPASELAHDGNDLYRRLVDARLID